MGSEPRPTTELDSGQSVKHENKTKMMRQDRGRMLVKKKKKQKRLKEGSWGRDGCAVLGGRNWVESRKG